MIFPRRAFAALCALLLWSTQAAAQSPTYQLEQVVELSRHGVRPPTPGNRKEIEAATQRPWTVWSTRDGELTGHGYAAVARVRCSGLART